MTGRGGLRGAVLTLVAGGVLAQALPLLLGPWLTRLYSPAEFGAYHLFAAVATNVAVVACARYEFALPLADGDVQAHRLRELCLRLLGVATLLAAIGAGAWWGMTRTAWVAWLPLGVAMLGLLSIATLWATRRERYRALAAARVAQYGGGALLQALSGLAGAGVHGLIGAPIAAAALAAALLRPAWRHAPPASSAPAEALAALARRFRDFPLLNTPHAFLGALQDTVAIGLLVAWQGPVAAGLWGLSLRYLKAPATLVGGAVSQVLYPRLGSAGGLPRPTLAGRAAVRRVMGHLILLAAPLVVLLWLLAPWLFERMFGAGWRGAGDLARALALYIGAHFVAAPLAVVTLAWGQQAWALRLAVAGQVLFVAALALGLRWGGLPGAGWAVSIAMTIYFAYYCLRLATWPVAPDPADPSFERH